MHNATTEQCSSAISNRRQKSLSEWALLSVALAEPKLVAQVDAAGMELLGCLAGGGTLLVAGNGGSAAIASHVAAELVGKCIFDRSPLPAINLGESLSAVTAVANDYGYEEIFARGVRAHGRTGDVLLAMSTSGSSRNILRALDVAHARNLLTIALTGERGRDLAERADHLLVAPSQETPRIQEVHMLWAHMWCEAVDSVCAS
ncbi:D-sedoheptulose-7-phosphate isomerase [Rudaeicoccus suwonensis]|uniref:Phosphoheptose isomerase n=1 Tax=Rudaeicoccus suwonensis TaxID=657409 RepID=A0A561DVM2_9MICO|nr:SIS domain-containing protein [Rudaeicoccus suwonensis]TWE07409.1 phosphoheptose isomerase [Rudaeicoccus suwonensis]